MASRKTKLPFQRQENVAGGRNGSEGIVSQGLVERPNCPSNGKRKGFRYGHLQLDSQRRELLEEEEDVSWQVEGVYQLGLQTSKLIKFFCIPFSLFHTSYHNFPEKTMTLFDVRAYSELYRGRTKILRLLFIAERCRSREDREGDEEMELEALRLAYDEIKKGRDTELFRNVVEKINGRLGPKYEMDSGWMKDVDGREELQKDRILMNLDSITTNVTESLRLGYKELGDVCYARGQLGDAFLSYELMLDYCFFAPNHMVDSCMNSILVSIDMGVFDQVASHVKIAENKKNALDWLISAKLLCASGLACLEAKKYKEAAEKFQQVAPELENSYNEVIADQDIATYGGICALASFERAELKSEVIDNVRFQRILDLEPKVKELINDFFSCRYGLCLDQLRSLKQKLLLDIHLHDHVESLYNQIRNRALVLYARPYSSLHLGIMAEEFMVSISELEKELDKLIGQNQIQAKIDSQNKILYRKREDKRIQAFKGVLQTVAEVERDLKAMLLRMALLKHESTE